MVARLISKLRYSESMVYVFPGTIVLTYF